MTAHTPTQEIFEQLLLADDTLKLTALRKAVLAIFIHAKKPLAAYEVLHQLKKKRDNAQPPTVYRVIEYFIEKHIIHRIDTENKYMLCTQIAHEHAKGHTLLLICTQCHTALEINDPGLTKALTPLAKQNHFIIDNAFIEVKGICQCCT